MSEFLVGFGRVDITPREPLPLMGYGNTMRRISANVLDPLYATCVAVSDGEGGLVLVLGVDAGEGEADDHGHQLEDLRQPPPHPCRLT